MTMNMKIFLLWTFVALLTFSGAAGQENEIPRLKEQIIELQNNGDLGFQNFILCSSIYTFASYVPLSEPVIEKTGSLLLYYEPLNIYTKKEDGIYEIWYTQDMVLLNNEETVIQEWTDILEFHHRTNKPVMDVFAQNSIDFDGSIPPGKYKFKAVLKDKLRRESVTKIIDFEIR
ncbi:hypothetical protein ACFLRW_02615 [Acidobacteriota bacterium]